MKNEAFLGLNARDMTNGELLKAWDHWRDLCASAPGWSSAHFSAKQLEIICKVSEERGLDFHNPYPIVYGCRGHAHHDDQPEDAT